KLEPRVLLLARVGLGVLAAAGPWLLDNLVVDPLLVERLLNLPARMAAELHPEVLATVELHCHQDSPFGLINVTPSRTVSITEVTRGSDSTCALNALIARVPSSFSLSSRTRPLQSVLSAAIRPRSVSLGRTAS